MSTIAKMVVGMEGDNSHLKKTFIDSAAATQRFASNVTATYKELHDSLKATLSATTAAVQKAARDRVISEEQARRQQLAIVGQFAKDEVALQMRFGLLKEQLERQQALRRQSAAEREVADMAERGRRSAEAYAISMRTGMNNAYRNINRVLGGGPASGGGAGFTFGGRRGFGRSRLGFAATSALFGIGNIGAEIAGAETRFSKIASGASGALHAVAGFAAFFGPEGLLVAGAAAAASAVISFFARAKDESARAAKSFRDDVNRMIDATDQLGLQKKLRDVTLGLPSAGASPDVANVFQGSLGEFRGRIAIQQAILERAARAGNATVATVVKKRIDDLKRQAAPLMEQERILINAIMNPIAQREIKGAKPIEVTAPGPGHEFDELQKSTAKVLRLYKVLHDGGQPVERVGSRIVAQYFALGRAIDSIRNPWDDQAVSLREMRAEIEKLIPLLKLAGPAAFPQVSTVPRAATPFSIPKINVPTIDATPKFDAITRIIGPTLANILSDAGGAIKSVLAGTLGAAIGPVALLFRAMEPSLQILSPLLDKFVAPLAAVVQVIVSGLEPALRLLFPIVKGTAIVMSVFSEVSSRVSAGVAQALGGLIKAIGSMIRHIPFLGGLGKEIQNFGQSLIEFASQTKKNADEMARTRKQLEKMQFGQTAESITGLGEAARRASGELLNVPYGFRIALERFVATMPVNSSSGPAGPTTSTPGIPIDRGAKVIHVAGNLIVQSNAKTAKELFEDIKKVSQDKSRQVFGTPARAGDVFGRS